MPYDTSWSSHLVSPRPSLLEQAGHTYWRRTLTDDRPTMFPAAARDDAIRDHRYKFDNTIGRLDRIISEVVNFSKAPLDQPDQQTLKHHAEDMIAAGQSILKRLEK